MPIEPRPGLRHPPRRRRTSYAPWIAVLVAVTMAVVPRTGPAAGVGSASPAAGRLLVATAQLVDPNFGESVVLLTQYDDSGAMGVIVNRPTSVPLVDAVPWASDFAGRRDVVHLGGPVEQDRMILLLRSDEPPPDSAHLFDDVHVSGSLATLRFAFESRFPEDNLRAFAGYAGWAPGQLEGEIARGDWRLLSAHAALVFGANPETLWRTLIERALLPHA